MKLSDLAGETVAGGDVEITGLTADSREVKPGYLFAALKGVKADGAAYIADAVDKGAAAILTAAGAEAAVPVIRDAAARARLARMAARFYPRQPGAVVAVTGTNGKSSTVEFLRQIWARAGLRAACVGTLGVTTDAGRAPLAHTTPDPVGVHKTLNALAEQGVSHAAMEASSHGLKQHRLDAVDLAAVGFTNLTLDHLDYHPDFEDYFAAKLRLFAELARKGAPAVINVDSEWGARVADASDAAGLAVTRVGWRGADLKLCELTPRPASQSLLLRRDGRELDVELPLVGEFQALNALEAAGLALATGVEEDTVIAALGALTGVAGRMQPVGATPGGAPVVVDFAHTPDGLEKLLRTLRPHTKGRIVIVFGAGGDRDPSKRRPMGEIAARFADAAVVTDDNPRSENPADIRRAVLAGCPAAEEIGDRAAAIRAGVAMLGPDDALVIAGKGHETGQEFAGRVVPFDDVEVARRALDDLAKGAEHD